MEKYTHDIGKMKKNRLMHFQVGLIIALVVALFTVNFTTDIYEKKDDVFDSMVTEDIPVIRTNHPENKITPPPVIKEELDEVILDDLIFEEEPEPVVEPTTEPAKKPTKRATLPGPKAPVAKKSTPVAPEPPVVAPPVIENNAPEIIEKFVEKMPRFKMPEDKNASEDDIKKHADAAMINYISKKIKYPAIARETGIEGTVVVRFVVEKNGEISNIEILRDPGFGLGEEAKKVVSKMPKWERIGRQNGRSVRVYFTMPIKFQLNN